MIIYDERIAMEYTLESGITIYVVGDILPAEYPLDIELDDWDTFDIRGENIDPHMTEQEIADIERRYLAYMTALAHV